MGFFGKLVKATVNAALTPVDIIKDVATLGGVMTDQREPYTKQRLDKVVKSVEKAADDAGDGDYL